MYVIEGPKHIPYSYMDPLSILSRAPFGLESVEVVGQPPSQEPSTPKPCTHDPCLGAQFTWGGTVVGTPKRPMLFLNDLP